MTQKQENINKTSNMSKVNDLNIEHDKSTNEKDSNVKDITYDDDNNMELQTNDSVLVRYFQRNSWKYYIGFVENINIAGQETYFTVLFLKHKKSRDSVLLLQKK